MSLSSALQDPKQSGANYDMDAGKSPFQRVIRQL